MTSKFVALLADDGQPMGPHALAAIERYTAPDLPFRAHQALTWTAADSSAAVAAWAPNDGQSWWKPTSNGVLIYAGSPRPKRGLWGPVRPLIEYLDGPVTATSEEARAGIRDPHAVVRLDDSGGGFILNDAEGMHPLFVARANGTRIVGNRASLVAEVLGALTASPPTRTCEDLRWLAFCGFMLDEATGYQGVGLLAQGARLVRDRGPWRVQRDPLPFENLTAHPVTPGDERIEEFIHDVADGIRHAISIAPVPPIMELTGGKDSRLLFAVAAEAGLLPSVRVVTNGPNHLPDRQVAQQIADQWGVPLTRAHEKTSAPTLADRYRSHVHRTSGLAGCWDSSEPGPLVTITGLGGEMLRSSRPGEIGVDNLRKATRRFGRLWYGGAALLRPEIDAETRARATELYLEPADEVAEPQDLDHAFYFRYRYRRWLGSRYDRFIHRVFPLVSPVGIRTNFEMGREQRFDEVIHRSVIERVSETLAAVPFANDAWRTRPVASRTPATRTASRKPKGVAGAKNVAQMIKDKQADEHVDLLQELINADRDNPAFDVLDRSALTTAADRYAELKPQERIQLLGAATMVIWGGKLDHDSADTWPEVPRLAEAGSEL